MLDLVSYKVGTLYLPMVSYSSDEVSPGRGATFAST